MLYFPLFQYDGQSDYYRRVLEKLNAAFTFVFLAEAILKLVAFKQVGICSAGFQGPTPPSPCLQDPPEKRKDI